MKMSEENETPRQVFDALMEFVKADDDDLEEYALTIQDFQERYNRAEQRQQGRAIGAGVN